jgi:uncharacterized protein
MPSSMLRWIWDPEHGEDVPTFANAVESASIITLIIRHWKDVNDTLNRAPDEYEPLILERKVDGRTTPIIDSWCSGYHKGIAVDRAMWNLLLAQHPEWFTAIMPNGTGIWTAASSRRAWARSPGSFSRSAMSILSSPITRHL